jgi:DNA-binding transcriptional LysR family regulator
MQAMTIFRESLIAAVPPGHPLAGHERVSLPDLAVRGLGVAILSESMGAASEGRLRALRLAGVDSRASLALTWRVPESPALQALLTHAREAFAPLQAA